MPSLVAAQDLAELPVVDGHCHPLLAASETLSRERFVDLFSEARPGTMRAHVEEAGYLRRALRAYAEHFRCDASVDAALARRRALDAAGVRGLFARSRIAALLVDTGYPAVGAMPLGEMARALPCAIHEVFRIETCAQALVPQALAYDDFLVAFRAALTEAASRAVALKSIIAYRSGLAVRTWAPDEAALAYREVVARVQRGGSPRLTEKPLLDTLFAIALDVCRDTGRPLQVHSGFGDPDVDLLQSNPLWLRPILEDPRWADLRLVVLHMSYPYAREAAFMASVWPQLHVDVSLAVPFLGPAAAWPLAEMLALAPATKLMYGSDVSALPELFAFSADWGRAALAEALSWLIEREGGTAADAVRIARRVLGDNARVLYGLPAA